VRGLLVGGAAAMGAAYFLQREWAQHGAGWAFAAATAALNTGLGCLIGGALMLMSSYYGKMRVRDRLLKQLNLTGNETVLDVGCGHGLLLIGAAKRLPRGRAVGIDLWSQVDQARNSRDATLRNAETEGVADRVEVRDGDMQELPFEDSSFDAVVASLAIHNIPNREGRRKAIREIVRVLKPGGQVALMDIKSVGLYAEELRRAGMKDVRISIPPSFWTWPPSRTVTAKKPD
jgi:ubiquinone/menaquinone biosynthesis C-methylase UbiE